MIEKYGHVVWRWYFTAKIRENILIFAIFIVFFLWTCDILLIYILCAYGARVHRLDIAQLEANGERLSRIASRLKVPLQTAQKIIKQWESVENIHIKKKRNQAYYFLPIPEEFPTSSRWELPKMSRNPELYCKEFVYFFSKCPEHCLKFSRTS